MVGPVVSRRTIAMICVVMFLGLLRAERGVAELQGRTGEPSRLFHVQTDGHGTWELSVLGLQRRVGTRIALRQGEGPLLTLPLALQPPPEVTLPTFDWHQITGLVTKSGHILWQYMQKAAHWLGGFFLLRQT